MRLPDRLAVGVPAKMDEPAPPTPHVEVIGFADLPASGALTAFAGKRTISMVGWHVLTHRRSDVLYRQMDDAPPDHAAVGHFERSRWTDEAWEKQDDLARATDAQAVVFRTPASFKPTADHATRLENFVAHATRPGMAICWEWAAGSWPERKALELCERIGAIPVLDPTEVAVPEGELIYLRFRGGAKGRKAMRDDDLKKVALEVRDRIGWVIFSNASAISDSDRFLQML